MRQTTRLERLTEAVERALPEEAELVETRFSGGPILTLLVDRENGPVDHEFCSLVVRAVTPALEGAGYDGMVEVSSPGIERPLTKSEHFERFTGHDVRVRVREAVNGRRNFTGTIERPSRSGFVLKLAEEDEEIELPYDSVTRAHLKEDV